MTVPTRLGQYRTSPVRAPLAGHHLDRGRARTWRVRQFGLYAANEFQVIYRNVGLGTRRAIPMVFCHGFGQGAVGTEIGDTNDLMPVASLGFPVLVADLGGFSTWGNDTSINRVDTLISWANTNLGTRADTVIIAGESMGTLTALNWAWRNPTKVAAIWLRAPIVHLAHFHDDDAGFGAAIEAAYGGFAGYTAALPTHDPNQNTAKIMSFADRMRLDAANADQFIRPADVLAFAQGVQCNELYWKRGQHADLLDTDPIEVCTWLDNTVRDTP